MYHLKTAVLRYVQQQMKELRDSYFKEFNIITFLGEMPGYVPNQWANQLELLSQSNKHIEKKLVILLSTDGGLVEAVEHLVHITRQYYSRVEFVILDRAMSCGTLWAISGEKIHMTLSSTLGPIDPQVLESDGRWIPIIGYLLKVEDIINRDALNKALPLEKALVSRIPLGELSNFDSYIKLTKELAASFLNNYHFSNAGTQNSTLISKSNEIADELLNTNKWLIHGRVIRMSTLKKLGLNIQDYSSNQPMRNICDNILNTLNEFNKEFKVPTPFILGEDTEARY